MTIARRAASQLLSQRSVHLRIVPRPSNLSESRDIFRVMQRFGEISTYKNLRYEYHNPAANIALAIYADPDSAQRALDASPLRFSLEKLVEDDHVGSDDVASSSEQATRDVDGHNANQTAWSSTTPPASTPHSKEPLMPFEELFQPKKTQTKWFQVTVDRSRVIHQDYVERQPLWKQFDPMKSLGQEALVKEVPLIGLSDVSKRPPNAHRTPNKILKRMANYVDNHMMGPKDMYEEWVEGKRR